jgi:hypothetical protein
MVDRWSFVMDRQLLATSRRIRGPRRICNLLLMRTIRIIETSSHWFLGDTHEF